MEAEDRAARWQRSWEQRRRRCLRDLAELPGSLTAEARAIVDEAWRLAAADDPAVHAAADVADLRDRVNALEDDESVQLHTPVANGISQLRIAAQELLAARAGAAQPSSLPLPRPLRRQWSGFEWFLVVGEDPELRELVSDSVPAVTGGRPIRTADTLEAARAVLRRSRQGSALVVVNLTLESKAGRGPHGLDVASEARHRHHAVLLVTAAGDYLHYGSRLQKVGLTGYDVVIKTRLDFAGRLRGRIEELAQPAPVPVSYDDDTGHVVWIGDVEVSNLEAQEALVLRALDGRWQTSSAISEECSDTDLAPDPGNVPPLIATLRSKLGDALTRAESALAACVLIESERRDGMATRYRLAPWLEWDDPPEPVDAASSVPPVLVVEDQPGWADWVVASLGEVGWPATVAATAGEARAALGADEAPILVVDLGLPDPVTGRSNPLVGLGLIEDLAEHRPGVRVVVLSVDAHRDGLRARLFEAGVRASDIIDKAGDREECRALLLASLQRAADEMRRGVRRARELVPIHRVERLERAHVQVDGHSIGLTSREAAVLDVLIGRHNQPVTADLLQDRCYPPSRRPSESAGKRLNPVHQTFKRLRRKIDREVGVKGVGAAVLRTPHRGARTTYELHGLVTDAADRGS